MGHQQGDPHATWPFFLARALTALLLSVALLANLSVARTELTGGLGLFAITDGVLCVLIWLSRRDARAFAYEGAVCIALGLGVLQIEPSALALLVFVATRALVVGAVELHFGWPRRHTALHPWLALSGGVSLLVGSGFSSVAAFGYDALELTPCIAGCAGIAGTLLLILALKLRVQIRPMPRDPPLAARTA